MDRLYDVGVYVRLSVEDNANSAKRQGGNPFQDQSVSIENQTAILTEYAMLRGWNLVQVYADDGFSGGNFQRPAFLRMVEDARAGRINLILCKDLSRLGRDYIEVGRYTDEVFPALGCRFIALMDDIDSEGNDDLLPFRSLLNDYHLKDLSRKIKSVLHAKAKAGEYIGAFAPYGYIKNPENTTQLIPDPYAAEVVRRIFSMRRDGASRFKIAAALNNEGILAPRAYWFHREGRENPYNTISEWRDCTVKYVLKNEVYLGHSVTMKTGTRSYKDKTPVNKPKENWARMENTHEPLISQDVWDAVRAVDRSKPAPAMKKAPEPSLFAGLLRCMDCGHTLGRNIDRQTRKDGREVIYYSYTCTYHMQTGRTRCSPHRIYELTLLQFIRADVQAQLELAELHTERIADRLRLQRALPSLMETKKELEQLTKRIGELEVLGASLYEDRLSGIITPESFLSLSASADEERSEKQAVCNRLTETLAAAEQATQDVTMWIDSLRQYLSLEKPDRAMLDALIEKIEIGEREGSGKQRRQDVRITYRFVGQMGGVENV